MAQQTVCARDVGRIRVLLCLAASHWHGNPLVRLRGALEECNNYGKIVAKGRVNCIGEGRGEEGSQIEAHPCERLATIHGRLQHTEERCTI